MWSPGVALDRRYELEERIGAGGFSEVWRARDLLLDRPVAVKVLLAPDGVVKITDFGIAYAVGSAGVTSTGLVVGTAGYLAPERAAGSGATALSDLYSLGVVAYECLTGAAPFAGTALEVALAHANRPFPAPPTFVPADVGALVAQLTAKDPAGRPGSAAEVAHQARQLSERLISGSGIVIGQSWELLAPADEPRPAHRPAGATSGGHSSRLHRSVAIGGVAVALAALLVLIEANIRDPRSAGHPAAAPSSSTTRPSSSTARPKSPAVVTVDVNLDSPAGQLASWPAARRRPRDRVAGVAG